MPRLGLLLAVLTFAPAVGAQTGPFAAFGHAAPERFLFPDDADPRVVIGYRLSPHVEIEGGYVRGNRSRILPYSTPDRIYEASQRTGAIALAGAYADRRGPALVRARLSIGYDIYSYRETETVAGDPFVRVDRAERSEYLHLGTSAEAALPLGSGLVRAAPAAGLAASLSALTTGSVGAQPMRVMPYVRLPLTAQVGGVGLTLAATAGVAFGARDLVFEAPGLYDTLPSRSAASKTGAPVLDLALRVDL